MIRFKFDESKAISSILYVAKKIIGLNNNKVKPDLHKIFKVLYFADQKHLARYGSPIVGDHYIAMEWGPVPSNIYDIIKAIRGDNIFSNGDKYNEYLEVRGKRYAYPKQDPNLDSLSESDIECIEESLNENQYLSFDALKLKSHDAAYCKAAKDDKIPFTVMATLGGADEDMLSYIRDVAENERLLGA